MVINWLAVLVAALVPTVIGFIWYNPKVFGNYWMRAAKLTEADIKGGNMAVIFILSFIFSFILAMSMNSLAVHQGNIEGLFMVKGQPPAAGSPEATFLADFFSKYGGLHRTFVHGLVHGIINTLFFGLPILATNAMFERKGWKYVLVNIGYWALTIGIMGGIVCAWV